MEWSVCVHKLKLKRDQKPYEIRIKLYSIMIYARSHKTLIERQQEEERERELAFKHKAPIKNARDVM